MQGNSNCNLGVMTHCFGTRCVLSIILCRVENSFIRFECLLAEYCEANKESGNKYVAMNITPYCGSEQCVKVTHDLFFRNKRDKCFVQHVFGQYVIVECRTSIYS